MTKKLIYLSTIDPSKIYKGTQLRILQSRVTNFDILGQFDKIFEEEKMESFLLEQQKNELTWQSSILPAFPKDKEGKVAQVYFCDEVNKFTETDEFITIQLVQISYFSWEFRKEGLSNNMDYFYFIGYDRNIVLNRVEQLVDYWNLEKM